MDASKYTLTSLYVFMALLFVAQIQRQLYVYCI
jgi:hypothetical protein